MVAATSLYWASTTLTTVGFSDITATNTREQYFTTCVQFLGLLTVGYCVGAITSAMVAARLNPRSMETKRKMAMINEYLRHKGFDEVQKRTIRLYFCKQFEAKSTDEETVLQLMPPPMRRDTVKFVYKELVSEMLLFRGMEDSVTIDLLSMLRSQFAAEHTIICAEGEPSEEIFILQAGLLRVSSCGRDLGFLHKGSFFGEVAAFGLGQGSEGRSSSRTVTAYKDSHLSYLTAEGIESLCKKHPQLATRLARQVELRKYKQDVALRAEKWAMVVPTEQDARDAFGKKLSCTSA